MISIFFLLTIMTNFVNAEMTYWNDVIVDYSDQTVSHHGFYIYDDTSEKGIGRNKPIDVILQYVVEGLPYNISNSSQVDWCNFTITQYANEYGTEFIAFQGFVGGEYLNTTTTIDSYYFQNTTNVSSGYLDYEMKDKDELILDMKCHYTEADDVFIESLLIGRVTTFFGAFECNECEEYSLEELSNEVERNEQIIEEQTGVYEKVQSVVDMNYQLWVIASWLVKISFLLIAIGLAFAGVYYLYKFFKDIEQQI